MGGELFVSAIWANGRALEHGCEWVSEVEGRRRRERCHFRVERIRRAILRNAEVTRMMARPEVEKTVNQVSNNYTLR